MTTTSGKKASVFSFSLLVGCFLSLHTLFAAAPQAEATNAKKNPESQGYTFFSSHDEIVAQAKKEGKLLALSLLGRQSYKPLLNAFKQRYPFIADISLEEIGATEAPQRLLLELKSGSATKWDVLSVAPDFYPDYLPYVKKLDILRMALQKVLSIPPAMIDPKNRSAVSITSSIHAIAYNKKILPENRVPASWEDFLKPELKGKKFLVDIRPIGFAAIAAGMGEEWMLDYARKIAAQDPIWIRGQSRYLTSIAVGEYSLFLLAFHYSCLREAAKNPTALLGCKVVEPVPARIQNFVAISNTASHPYAGLLWLEFLATPEGQKIIDQYEPFNASIYSPGSKLATLIKGKKVSVNNWETIHNSEKWQEMAVETFGFPNAAK
jgi:ABC-type Fe3+ transport system substrate-binding protein